MLALGLQGSPNHRGSTDYLLKEFMTELAARGLRTHTIDVARKNIQPCKGCGYCSQKGICVIQDDDMANEIYALLREADLIVVASPVFFYSVPSQLKALIDRTQVFWSRKYRLQLPDPLQKPRKGFLLSLGGSQGKQLFTGIQLVAKYFFDAVDAEFIGSLTYRNIETRKDIMQHSELKNDIVRAVETILSPAPQPKPASNRESPTAVPQDKNPPYHESTKGRKHEKYRERLQVSSIENMLEAPMATPEEMYQCQTVNCGYIYNPDKGDRKGKIPKETSFTNLPDDWKCPVCGAGKKMFRPLAGPGSALAEG